jgi:adenylate kinase
MLQVYELAYVHVSGKALVVSILGWMGAIKVKGVEVICRANMSRIVSLTGTPGTGKTSVAGHLAGIGWHTIELTELALREGAVVGRDEARQTDEVDVDLLRDAVTREVRSLPTVGDILLVSHLSHLMTCETVIVLRTSPRILRQRLEARGWTESKVMENLEAEAVGVILVEAMELEPAVPVLEADTTSEGPDITANRIANALGGEEADLEAGRVDWSEEVMEWY